jgi:hypothetical protein
MEIIGGMGYILFLKISVDFSIQASYTVIKISSSIIVHELIYQPNPKHGYRSQPNL